MGGGEGRPPPDHAVDHGSVARAPVEQEVCKQDHIGVPLRMTVGHPQPSGAGAGPVIDPAQIVARTEGAQFGELEPVATSGGNRSPSPAPTRSGRKRRLIRSSVGRTRTLATVLPAPPAARKPEQVGDCQPELGQRVDTPPLVPHLEVNSAVPSRTGNSAVKPLSLGADPCRQRDTG